MKRTVFMAQAVILNKCVSLFDNTKKRLADDRGGVSPLVVTIGLALLLLGVIIAFSSTLRSAVSTAIDNVISKLNSLN